MSPSNPCLSNNMAGSDTTWQEPEFAGLPTVEYGTPRIPIEIDPGARATSAKPWLHPEVVYVWNHEPGAVAIVIQRGCELTNARNHLLGTPWVLGHYDTYR